MIDSQFLLHNRHLESVQQFKTQDPQLRVLGRLPYQYLPPLLQILPTEIPGIYTICGGRQIGKSTVVKQWMLKLLESGVLPQSIAYFTGETIVDHISLIRQIQSQLEQMPQEKRRYLMIDEVTYITNWDMGVKFLADAGLLENVILVLTGSDSVIIQEARMRFPGRRGLADEVNFHLYPLTFYEMLKLTGRVKHLDEELLQEEPSQAALKQLQGEFEQYLIHGGYLTAINNMAMHGRINKAVLETYADWVRGDVIKHGKSDAQCREFFMAMSKRLHSQVTWTSLAKDFAIVHHMTIAEYADLLMSMDVIYIQQALMEDKLIGAPKKARKLIFMDPFIYHSIMAWLHPSSDPFELQIKKVLQNPEQVSALVEACVVSHYRRWFPTYYIKAEGEVDVAYVDQNQFWPVEVKWTQQMRPSDLKQIQKYKNGIILGKQLELRPVGNIMSYPLPWYLARMGLNQ